MPLFYTGGNQGGKDPLLALDWSLAAPWLSSRASLTLTALVRTGRRLAPGFFQACSSCPAAHRESSWTRSERGRLKRSPATEDSFRACRLKRGKRSHTLSTHHCPISGCSLSIPEKNEQRGYFGVRTGSGWEQVAATNYLPNTPLRLRNRALAHFCMASRPASMAADHAGRSVLALRAWAAAVRNRP